MPLYGLIGYPLTHSFSPAYFEQKFREEGLSAFHYRSFPLEDISQLPALIESTPALAGLNVTIPHKISVIPYLEDLSDPAKDTGAVNTILIQRKNGATPRLIGYNTDIDGFEQSLRPLLKPWHQQALILGSGGASRAVQFVLRKLRIPFLIVSRNRNKGISYQDITTDLMESHTLIINTTPLGMYPAIQTAPPIPYHFLSTQHLLYDLVYNPDETPFLLQGKAHGSQTTNGLPMLRLQAEASWKIWQSSLLG